MWMCEWLLAAEDAQNPQSLDLIFYLFKSSLKNLPGFLAFPFSELH